MAGEAVAATAVGGFVFLFIFIWLAAMALGILALVIWIFMIIDVAKRDFKQDSDKVMWILIIVLTGIIGALIYYFMIKKPDKH